MRWTLGWCKSAKSLARLIGECSSGRKAFHTTSTGSTQSVIATHSFPKLKQSNFTPTWSPEYFGGDMKWVELAMAARVAYAMVKSSNTLHPDY